MAARLPFWRRVAATLRAGEPLFLALVVESTAHSPGTAGAGLFVTSRETGGTIGGGVMELRVIERARSALESGEVVRELVDLRHRREVADGEERSGMICAGRQTNLYLTLEPGPDLERVSRWLDHLEREEGTLRIDASGLELQPGPGPQRPRLIRGEAWKYLEPALERRRLAILGGGHCGQALARLMSQLGWRVTVWETRPALAGAAERGAAERGAVERGAVERGAVEHGAVEQGEVRLVEDFRAAGELIEHAEITPVVIMTTDVPNDVRALGGALRRPFPFIGAMGSRAKLEEIRRRLVEEEGLDPSLLERLTAPVGLAVGSDTPAEIAVSVAAQLLSRRRDWWRAADGEMDAIEMDAGGTEAVRQEPGA